MAVCSEVNFRSGTVHFVESPRGYAEAHCGPGIEQRVPAYAREHPVVRWYRRTRDGRAVKISDFASRGEFHRLGVYQEFYRRLRVEDQLSFRLPTPRHTMISLSVARRQRSFSERDRLMLNLLRPHVIAAVGNLEALARARGDAPRVELPEARRFGIIRLDAAGRMVEVDGHARAWIVEYLGGVLGWGRHLPVQLERWLRAGDEIAAPPPPPLVLRRGGKTLTVRPLAGSDQRLLLLEEREALTDPAMLGQLGLTRREGELLVWLAQGKSNDAIATILGRSVRTVEKHLESVYRKLDVDSRTGAVARVLGLIQTPAAEAPFPPGAS
ncbi:MAG: helix-turn-helix domain-containing protein [Candidatus Rokubacteria bacterium]|nr:helix-turn-helix domain-containing protein [Candidatus Rokubacteria bacterium]